MEWGLPSHRRSAQILIAPSIREQPRMVRCKLRQRNAFAINGLWHTVIEAQLRHQSL